MTGPEAPKMQVTVLGPTALLRDDERVELGASLQRLLAALVVADGEVVSVDRLVDIVWSGRPASRPESTLRSYLTRLRKALDTDGDAIQRRKPGYVLELGPDQLDATQFLDELDRARSLLRAGDAEAAIPVLDTALARWRGPALAGVAEEEWARPTAVRLEERRVEALEALIEAQLDVGRVDTAVASSRSLVADEPLREHPRALLMRALYQSGRQAEALREYSAFRRHLADETGLDPSAELVDLEGRIARGELDARSSSRPLGSYELAERIGAGAFAVVHRAVQPGLERDVAVKIIRAELADSPEFIRRFEIEARTVARIEHPHVVPLYDFWREPGAAYLVMRLLRGGTLQDALRSGGPLSRDRVVEILGQVGGALGAAHAKGVIHRDVRPANLLLDEQGVAYLADFGIALPAAQSADAAVATPAYASPEVLRGEPAGVTADVLSLGVTIFELLTGRLPFADSIDHAELVRRQMSEPLPSVCATRTDLPAAIDQILARATSKVAADRHASVAALVSEVQAVLSSSDRASHTPRPVVQGPIDNPYVGLHAFDEQDSDRFHGRDALVTELVEALAERRLVVAVGPSGSGKSSVVRAGLLPAIRRGAVNGSDSWFVTTMLPGADPIASLESALLRVAVNPPASLRQQLQEDGGLLRAIRRVLPDERAEILLVIDQFEELFTQVEDPVDRDRFLSELAAAITAPRSPLRVIATMRADHYDDPLRHREMAGLVTDGTVTVRPMTPSELERAIVAPAADVGVDVEPALVAELVAGIDARPAALPLLQFSLTEVFERRVAGVMLLDTHREIGGLTGAVAERAERIAGDEDADVEVVRRILGRLVTVSDHGDHTRRRARQTEFGDDARTAWLIDAFVTARLLTTGRDHSTREPTLEVAHESLLRDWPRLRQWVDEDRHDLQTLHQTATAAREWDRGGRQRSELARGARLAGASNLAARRPDWVSKREHSWIAASLSAAQQAEDEAQARAERDRRQNRRLRRLLAAAACLLVVAVGAAAIALTSRNRADSARVDAEAARASADADRDDAEVARADAETARADAVEARAAAEIARNDTETARTDAEIERLSALSAAEIGTEPDRAILLALEANRRRDDVATQTAVHRTLAAEPRLVSVHPDPFDDASLSDIAADGSAGVTVSISDGRVAWFDPSTGDIDIIPFSAEEPVSVVAISDDGSTAALALRLGGVVVIDRAGNERLRTGVGEFIPFGVTLDAQGTVLAVGRNQTNEVLVIDVDSGEIRSTATLDEDLPGANAIDLSPDGALLAVGANPPGGTAPQSAVYLFDTPTGERRERWENVPRFVTDIDLSSHAVVTGYQDGTVTIRSLDDGAAIDVSAHAGSVEAVAFAPDGRALTAGGDEVKIWSPDGRPQGRPLDTASEVGALGVTPTGQLTMARFSDGYVVADPSGGALIEELIPVVGPSGLSPFHRYHDMAGEFPNDPTGEDVETALEQLRIVDLATGDVVREIDHSDIFDGAIAQPFYSTDGEWVLTPENQEPPGGLSVLTEIRGEGEYVFASADLFESMFGEQPDGGSFFGTRPEAGGERLFSVIRNSDGRIRAGWFDSATRELVAGPLELDFGGRVLLLDDGRALVGGSIASAPLAVLPADLSSEPIVIEGTEGLEPLHQDGSTGLVIAGGPGGRAGLIDPDHATFTPIAGLAGTMSGGAFSPDGSRIALRSIEAGVQLVDAATLEPIGVPVDIGDAGFGFPLVSWSDDDTSVWTATANGPVRIAADPDRWVELACEATNRQLSELEWESFVDDGEPVPVCRG